MTDATLYTTQGKSETVPLNRLGLHFEFREYANSIDHIAVILDCSPSLVDILATGDVYVAFSIFDYEGAVNIEAMRALAQLTGYRFDTLDEDQILRGPILLIQQNQVPLVETRTSS